MKTDLIGDVRVPEILLVYLRISYPYTYKLLQLEEKVSVKIKSMSSGVFQIEQGSNSAESVLVLFLIMS